MPRITQRFHDNAGDARLVINCEMVIIGTSVSLPIQLLPRVQEISPKLFRDPTNEFQLSTC